MGSLFPFLLTNRRSGEGGSPSPSSFSSLFFSSSSRGQRVLKPFPPFFSFFFREETEPYASPAPSPHFLSSFCHHFSFVLGLKVNCFFFLSPPKKEEK